MRSLIQQLINNQRYLSIAIFGSLITFLSLWYFLFYQNINNYLNKYNAIHINTFNKYSYNKLLTNLKNI